VVQLMIDYISQKMATFFIDNNVIDREKYKICKYGLELMISSILGVLIIVTLGILCASLLESVVFLICFISLRSFTGGYHAKNYFQCDLIFAISFLLCLFLFKMFYYNLIFSRILSTALFVLSFWTIFFFSPVENPHKPILNIKRSELKKKGLLIECIEFLFMLIMMYFGNKIYVFISFIMTLVGMTMIVEILKRRCINYERNHKIS
jgi:accessory gene regulator B